MVKQKQGQFYNLHRIPNKTSNPDFRFLLFFSGLKKNNCNFYRKIFPHQKNKTKIKNRDSKFCAEFDILLSIIRGLYIIYCVLLGGFDAINASNQRTICSCMMFRFQENSTHENSTHENSTHENSTHENSTQRKFHPRKIPPNNRLKGGVYLT